MKDRYKYEFMLMFAWVTIFICAMMYNWMIVMINVGLGFWRLQWIRETKT